MNTFDPKENHATRSFTMFNHDLHASGLKLLTKDDLRGYDFSDACLPADCENVNYSHVIYSKLDLRKTEWDSTDIPMYLPLVRRYDIWCEHDGLMIRVNGELVEMETFMKQNVCFAKFFEKNFDLDKLGTSLFARKFRTANPKIMYGAFSLNKTNRDIFYSVNDILALHEHDAFPDWATHVTTVHATHSPFERVYRLCRFMLIGDDEGSLAPVLVTHQPYPIERLLKGYEENKGELDVLIKDFRRIKERSKRTIRILDMGTDRGLWILSKFIENAAGGIRVTDPEFRSAQFHFIAPVEKSGAELAAYINGMDSTGEEA